MLHGIDVAVAPGTLAVLLGPSGWGNSTLLRLIGGTDVTARPPSGRNRAMAFQIYALFPRLDAGNDILSRIRRIDLTRPDVKYRLFLANILTGVLLAGAALLGTF